MSHLGRHIFDCDHPSKATQWRVGLPMEQLCTDFWILKRQRRILA